MIVGVIDYIFLIIFSIFFNQNVVCLTMGFLSSSLLHFPLFVLNFMHSVTCSFSQYVDTFHLFVDTLTMPMMLLSYILLISLSYFSSNVAITITTTLLLPLLLHHVLVSNYKFPPTSHKILFSDLWLLFCIHINYNNICNIPELYVFQFILLHSKDLLLIFNLV